MIKLIDLLKEGSWESFDLTDNPFAIRKAAPGYDDVLVKQESGYKWFCGESDEEKLNAVPRELSLSWVKRNYDIFSFGVGDFIKLNNFVYSDLNHGQRDVVKHVLSNFLLSREGFLFVKEDPDASAGYLSMLMAPKNFNGSVERKGPFLIALKK